MKAEKIMAEYRHAKRQVRDEKVHLQKAVSHAKAANKAQRIVQAVAQKVQQQAHTQITALVTKCLRTVFPEKRLKFEIEFQRKRGKTEARLYFLENEKEMDPIFGSGGGIVDVASFALRLACIMLQRPRRRRLIVADEPFKFVSEDGRYRERVAKLVETLSTELNFQFIIVTHDKTLKIGKVIPIQ